MVGASWLVMTVGFELGFGRLVAKQSWEELLAGYDVTRGRRGRSCSRGSASDRSLSGARSP